MNKLLIASVLSLATPALAASCGAFNTTTTFTSQSDMAGFNCIDFQGSLLLSGPGITDLTPLASLQTIQTTLKVDLTSLSNLNGLGNLKAIGNGFLIHRNLNLVSLDGITSLTKIGINLVYF